MATGAIEFKDEDELSDKLSEDSDDEEDSDFPVLLILTTGIWTILFAVFTFGFDTDPDSCVVSNKEDLIGRMPYVDIENPTNPATIDVATRFRFFFNTAFMICCI